MDPTGNELPNSPFVRQGLSAELVNELFGSLPFHKAFRLLTKMPNGLLARNVQKMLKNIKMAMKKNKLDKTNIYGRISTISEDGLIATSIGYNNSVQAISPIPSLILTDIIKPTIIFYYEIQILHKAEGRFFVGFLFPDLRWFPSIEISHKGGMAIGGFFKNFENDNEDFVEGDFVGLGIIHHPDRKIECFATCNYKLLGKVTLPSVYQDFKLFPTVRLYTIGDSVRMNFGKDEWQFKEFGLVL